MSFEVAADFEDVSDVVISFVAALLVDGPFCFDHRHLGTPRAHPGGRVGDRELVVNAVGGDTGEALHDVQVSTGASIAPSFGEVPSFDHQRIVFPPTS